MAKLNEDIVVVKVSKLLRDDESASELLDGDVVAQLEAVIQELVGANTLVEIIKE